MFLIIKIVMFLIIKIVMFDTVINLID